MEHRESILAPYRVLDLSNEWGFLCGRLLADLGADVVKVEKPGGEPARNIAPFFKDEPNPEKSLYWLFYNANKKGITLDIERSDGKEIFKKLVKKADFVIESFEPGYMDDIGLGYSLLSEINSRIVMTSITPFGQSGPYRDITPSDIAVTALSGWMYQCGDPDRAPVRISLPQSYLHASAQAAGGSLVAHYHREMTGEGQHYDAPALPWLTFIHQNHNWYLAAGTYSRRQGQRWEWTGRAIQRYVWECKNGYVAFAMIGFPASNKALAEWMDSEGMAPAFFKEIDWWELDFSDVDQELRNRIEDPIMDFFRTHTREEIFKEAVSRRILILPVFKADDMLESPELAARQYWTELEHPELGTSITFPGAFFKSSETLWNIKRRAPLIGEHNEEIYMKELGFSREEYILLKENHII